MTLECSHRLSISKIDIENENRRQSRAFFFETGSKISLIRLIKKNFYKLQPEEWIQTDYSSDVSSLKHFAPAEPNFFASFLIFSKVTIMGACLL
jgi:hypothetical protein